MNMHIYFAVTRSMQILSPRLGTSTPSLPLHCFGPIKLGNPDSREGMLSSVSCYEKMQNHIAERMVRGWTDGLWSFLPSTTPGKFKQKYSVIDITLNCLRSSLIFYYLNR